MPAFRSTAPVRSAGPPGVSLETVAAVIGEAFRPGHFFLGRLLPLEWQPQAPETILWEIFQGRLLDAPFTRQRRSFTAWNVFLRENGQRSAEPLLAVKLDAAGQVHVVRAIYSHAWEGYHA